MMIPPDFREFFVLLNKHEVEYLIVGSYALAFHGSPRYTGDVDVLVRRSPENAARVLKALDAFGFSFPNLTAEDFVEPENTVQLGMPPVRIDLLTSITGVSWEEADASKVQALLDGVPVRYIGREQYVANKRALGRKKDLADLEALGET